MKTTNYGISKRLAEARFAYDYDCGYTHKGKLIDIQEQMGAYRIETPSFCLETILEALPKEIKKLNFWATWSTSSDCYIFGYIDGIVRNTELETATEQNESLADTAAKLWLKLKQKGLV